MAVSPITPSGSPLIQPLTGGDNNHGLPTPPQTPQQGGVIDFDKIPPLSLDSKKVQEPANHEENHEGGFKGALGKMAEHTWAAPALSKTLDAVSKSEGGVGGAFKAAGGAALDVTKNNFESLKSLPTSPKQALLGAYTTNLADTDTAPDSVRKLASKLS